MDQLHRRGNSVAWSPRWDKERYRVARGLEETWGRERNSSRSTVPELSWKQDESSCWHREECVNLIQLHEPLSQSVDFIAVNWIQTDRQRYCFSELNATQLQLEPWMISSKNWLVEPVVLRRASSKAALFGSAASVDMVTKCCCTRSSRYPFSLCAQPYVYDG